MIWVTRTILSTLIFCKLLHAQEHWVFLDNGHVRIGINKDAGGSVGWFSKSRSGENLLNTFDHGRYVQQSYYGEHMRKSRNHSTRKSDHANGLVANGSMTW